MQGFQDSSGPPNVAQLQVTMQAIELACASIQMHINPSAAEATILSLRQSPHPYQTCQFILENSQVANARFQAAAAIRDAAIREWSFLTADVKKSLISFCLCYIMQHASSPERYVQAKVSAVAAQLMKRGWLDFEASERESFFYQINQSIQGAHGSDVQFCGINFLESLVSEFSPSTSSAMGLPREFHEQCRRSLELNYLKTLYCWAKDAAASVTSIIIDSQIEVPEVKVCTAALRLMFQILNWDFHNTVGAKANINFYFAGVKDHGDSTKRSEYNLVQPGPDWCDVLVSSGHISWLLNLYAALRQKFSCQAFWLDCPIAVSARKLIVQFCSLAGTIFHSESVLQVNTVSLSSSDVRHSTTMTFIIDELMHENHLLQLLLGIMQWIDPPDAVSRAIENGKCESEMLDGCRALLSIATVTTPFVFDQLLKSIRPFGTLQLLSSLMGEVVKVLMTHNSDEETWSWQARDILLDSWTALLIPLERSGRSSLLPHEGISAAANLFALIVESELKVASASASDDNVESEYFQASVSAMDERLSAYALLARAAINVTVPFLMGLFTERLSKLNKGRCIIDVTETLEEIYSLLLIIGHVLADEVEGETPLVPNAIQSQFTDVMEADKHPVVALSSLIIRFGEQSLDPQTRASIFSPRLMESVIWFLSRWSSTYLLHPEEIITSNCNYGKEHDHEFQPQHTRKVLYSFFGEHGQGIPIVDIIVRISATTLLSYPGEKYLHALTCNQLLHALVRQKHICNHLVALDSWRSLTNAFDNEKKLFLLDFTHQRSLAQTLVRSASGLRNIESSNQYVRDLMGNTATHLVETASRKDLTSIAQQPDVMVMISCLLERLRGAACASEPRTQKAIYELGFSVMNPVLVLLAVYKDESAVVYMLLKFVVHWVDGQINYLEAQETAIVVDLCMRLLQLYSSHNIGRISLSLSRSLLNEAKTEKYRDLRALLQLLSNLCSKDLVDFSSDNSEVPATDISQVVYFGLHIISPLISLDLLKYPKLCQDYFSLLSHLLEVYPETVAKLNHEAFTQVLKTLDFGLHHQDTEVVDMCLKALKSLSSYHFKEISAGNLGLGSQVIFPKDAGEAAQEGVLSGFLKSLLQLLLFEDYSPDLVGNAADALFPLILCEQPLYQKLATELIERQVNTTFKSRIANALHTLTSANQLSSVLDRINSQRFRKNLHNFLIEVRGFLRTV